MKLNERAVQRYQVYRPIYRFDIASKVPIHGHGQIAYEELARLGDMYEPDLRRILRFAICYHRAFCEPRKGFVAHTAASRSIVENSGIRETLGVMFDGSWQAYSRVSYSRIMSWWALTRLQTVEAMEKFKNQEPSQAVRFNFSTVQTRFTRVLVLPEMTDPQRTVAC